MDRVVQPAATRGSQRWLQRLVRTSPQRLESAIGLGLLEWLSPLEDDEFSEYRDQGFLDRLGVGLDRRPLEDFWPSQGPVWDGLARTLGGACVLIEAKSHRSEMVSSCTAQDPSSLAMIQSAFRETQDAFDVEPGHDWCDGHYQYANRLAHAYLMNELNGIPTTLAFVYFVGDTEMGGPASREEWISAVLDVHERLGVSGLLPRYVKDVFVDVTNG